MGRNNLPQNLTKIFLKTLDKQTKVCYNIDTVKEVIKMTVAELIDRLSKYNKDYVIYRDYGNGLEEASWGDFMEEFWIWDKSEVEEDN